MSDAIAGVAFNIYLFIYEKCVILETIKHSTDGHENSLFFFRFINSAAAAHQTRVI